MIFNDTSMFLIFCIFKSSAVVYSKIDINNFFNNLIETIHRMIFLK